MTAREVLKRFGLRRAMPYYAYRLAQRCCTLDITHLQVLDANKTPSIEQLDPSLEFRQLSADDVRRFATEPSNELDASLAARLTLGKDLCFAALRDGKLASYCWVALDSIEGHQNRGSEDHRSGVALSFPPDYAFRYQGFTHPDFRGCRIYQQLSSFASRELRAKYGVRYQLSTAEWVNYGALRASYRGGFEYLGLVVVFGFGDYLLRRGPRHLERCGVLFGHRAKVLCREQLTREKSLAVAADAGEFAEPQLKLVP